jgi:hypothetical protein
MGFMHRATVAAGIGFAVSAIAGCGSGGRLLSSAESRVLNEQLSRVSEALTAGDCNAAQDDLTAFQNRVSSLNGVNSTLIQNLTQGANTVQRLTSVRCSELTGTTTTKKKSRKKTQTTTSTKTQTDTTTTATDTSTVNTNTYTTSTYTAPDQYTQTSTTGGSGLGNYTTSATTTTATTEPTTTSTTSTTTSTPPITTATTTTSGTDTTGGGGF